MQRAVWIEMLDRLVRSRQCEPCRSALCKVSAHVIVNLWSERDFTSVSCVFVSWLFDLNLSGERKVPQCFQFRGILPVCAKTAVQLIQTGFSCRHRSRSARIYCSIRLANVRIKSWFLLGSLILGGSALTASCWRCLILDLTTRLFLCFAARCFCNVVTQNVFMLETESSCFHQFVFYMLSWIVSFSHFLSTFCDKRWGDEDEEKSLSKFEHLILRCLCFKLPWLIFTLLSVAHASTSSVVWKCSVEHVVGKH